MSKTSFPKDKIKIVLFENIHSTAVDIFKKAGYNNVELLTKALPKEELIEKLRDVRIIGIRSKTKMTEEVLRSAKKLMAIGCFCIGTNQVDLDVANNLGIAVFNSPYSNTRSVAELVIAEAVILMRRIGERSRAAHDGIWLKDAINSREVRGKTIGIIGYGHIGSQVSVLAEAMGMHVVYYDIEPKLPLGNATPINSLEELLTISDIVTLHVPATDLTHNMMNASMLAKMKKGALLLNLSRGTVVDIDALKAALETGALGGAAIDVYPKEPKAKGERFESPLQGLNNVVLTPHIGGSTMEAQINIGKDAAFKLVDYLDKGKTIGSKTVPPLNLSWQNGTTSSVKTTKKIHRLLHIHKNETGILNQITQILSKYQFNIEGQYLKTNEKIGYVVVDVSTTNPNWTNDKELLKELEQVDNTVKTRWLY